MYVCVHVCVCRMIWAPKSPGFYLDYIGTHRRFYILFSHLSNNRGEYLFYVVVAIDDDVNMDDDKVNDNIVC